MSRLENLNVAVLEPASDNPRRNVDADPEMVDTMKSLGVLEPLVVTKSRANGYVVIAGHRRLAAAKAAGLDEVPCVVHDDLDDRTRAEMMLVENLQREDLTPLEEAAAYQRLIDLGHKQRDLAKIVGRSQPHISKRTALLKLPEKARNAVDSGGITIELATAAAGLPKDRVEKLFEGGRVPDRWAVDNAVRKVEEDKKIAASTKVLEKAGVTVIERNKLEDGLYQHELAELGIDPKVHATEPCHAGTLDWRNEPVLICLTPGRHDADGDSTIKASPPDNDDDGAEYVPPAETAEQKKARLERERERKAEEAKRAERQRLIGLRLEFAATIVQKADLGDVVELMAMALAANVYIEAAAEDATVLRLVGLGDVEWNARTEKARAFVDESDRNKARFVAAAAVSALETIAADWYEDDDESLRQARGYLAWLVARGYEPSDVDRSILAPNEPEVAGHEISIEPVGKAKPPKKYRVRCSCGDLDAQQTSEDLARERHATHLADVGWEQG